MSKFNDILNLIHRGKNPYEGFPVHNWRGCWYGDPGAQREILLRNLDKANPGLVVEVGSFVGESAIFMAKHLKSRGADAVILCIDTFCGGVDHWLRANEKIQFHFGRVDLYYKFVANVIEHGCADMIVPLSLDSMAAARLLKALNVQAEFVYADASHEEGDAGRDFANYWDLLKPGGILTADDVSNHFPGVVKDWTAFLAERNLTPYLAEGEKQSVIKP